MSKKENALTVASSVALTDQVRVVSTPSSAPTSKLATVSTFFASIVEWFASLGTLTGATVNTTTDTISIYDDSAEVMKTITPKELVGTCRRYLATYTQAFADAPAPTVLVNTLGVTPTWARSSTGFYTITSTGAWNANTIIRGPGAVEETEGGLKILFYNVYNANTLQIFCVDEAGSAIDINNAGGMKYVEILQY